MKTLQELKKEQMKNPEFVKEYDAIQPEMDVIRAIVDARTSQNITQKELAERTGINQADISKLENGTRNPSINLLKRLAEGMGMVLKIEFVLYTLLISRKGEYLYAKRNKSKAKIIPSRTDHAGKYR